MAYSFCVHIGSKQIRDFVEEHFGNKRLPLHGGIEITSKCNLACVHCYAESCRSSHKRDMANNEVKYIIDQITDAGAIEIFLTGGEVLVRPDFEDIYVYAKKKGLIVALLSNAVLFNERIINTIMEYPVSIVSITMYGRTREVYEAVTRVPGSHDRFMKCIEMLNNNRVPFELKAIGLKTNYHEILHISDFAKELNVSFRYAFNIRPMSDGNIAPLNLRLSSDEAFWFDINDEARRNFWRKVALDESIQKVGSRRQTRCLYLCQIAQKNFFISSEGLLRPCNRVRYSGYDLLNGNFIEGWDTFCNYFVDAKASEKFPCPECVAFKYCEQCTADFAMENQNPEEPIPFVCQVAHKRLNYCLQYKINSSS
jgi:MoaA/NifB/PqqE/SkfB family radical SAM enzyme